MWPAALRVRVVKGARVQRKRYQERVIREVRLFLDQLDQVMASYRV